MTETRTPNEIAEQIAREQQALTDSIRPLAVEAIELFNSIRAAPTYARIVEIASMIPKDQAVAKALHDFIRVANLTPNAIQVTYPTPIPPEALTPGAFKTPDLA